MKRFLLWGLSVGGVLLLILFGVAVWGWQSLYSPVSVDTNLVSITVTTGENSHDIIGSLADHGVIRSSFWLATYLRISPNVLLPGIYSLDKTGSSLENITPLFVGTVTEKQVTIPEGLRATEAAQILEKQGVLSAADFLTAATYDTAKVTLPAGYQLKQGDSLEGFLFPDTYRFSAKATPAQVIEKLLTNYQVRTEGISVRYPTLSYQTLILASIVEREAKFDDDRAQIAGVYTNRLTLGMPLQSNPTVEYAKANLLCGSKPLTICTASTWWPPLITADFASNSPYNTYQVLGLPPTPIANPGVKSIEAAAYPAINDNLYFVTDSVGHAHFAKTLAEHNQNVAKYLSN